MRNPSRVLRLGHIAYSNCEPVHARLLRPDRPAGIEIVAGTPAELNRALAEGAVDVAPASSIEFARHRDRYRILPELSISSRGPVRTILLLSTVPGPELDGATVALPTASATSVVLLKILLELRDGLRPRYAWFRQESEDPFRERAEGVKAALYIGDAAAALGRKAPRAHVYDLGAEWTRWTGLPFVFALWQTPLGDERRDDLRALHARLLESRAWALERLGELARERAAALGWPPAELEAYWRSLDYGLDDALVAGLREFYRRAAELGEIDAAPELVFLE